MEDKAGWAGWAGWAERLPSSPSCPSSLSCPSGPFLTPSFTSGDPSGTGANVRGFTSTTRPDQTGDGNLADPTVDRFFDRTCLREDVALQVIQVSFQVFRHAVLYPNLPVM